MIPFIISQRHLQQFDINEMKQQEIRDPMQDILETNENETTR